MHQAETPTTQSKPFHLSSAPETAVKDDRALPSLLLPLSNLAFCCHPTIAPRLLFSWLLVSSHTTFFNKKQTVVASISFLLHSFLSSRSALLLTPLLKCQLLSDRC
jgi:hypothetical protein